MSFKTNAGDFMTTFLSGSGWSWMLRWSIGSVIGWFIGLFVFGASTATWISFWWLGSFSMPLVLELVARFVIPSFDLSFDRYSVWTYIAMWAIWNNLWCAVMNLFGLIPQWLSTGSLIVGAIAIIYLCFSGVIETFRWIKNTVVGWFS